MQLELITRGERLLEIPTKTLLIHINSLIEEKAYIINDKKFSFAEEQEWKESIAKKIELGIVILLIAWDNEKIAGIAQATRGIQKECFNTTVGIGISKEYRGKGLGKKLLQQCIKYAKKLFKPKHIILQADAKNKIALNLYKKLGFKKIAVLKGHLFHYGEWHDHVFMELKKRKKPGRAKKA